MSQVRVSREGDEIITEEHQGGIESEAAQPEASPAAVPDVEIPEQFKNEDGSVNLAALLKSQADGQAEVTRLRQEASKPAEDSAGEVPPEGAPKQNEAVAKATQEFNESGKLSAETYESLESVGLSKAIVDSYIQGQVAQKAAFENSIFELAGGRENYQKILEWGAEVYSDAEQDSFNEALQSGVAGAKAAVTNLVNRYKAEADIDGEHVDGDSGGTTPTGEHFKDKTELVAAMADPRYKKSKAYRDEVDKKLMESERLGINLGISTGATDQR